jgi:hypothetical protein
MALISLELARGGLVASATGVDSYAIVDHRGTACSEHTAMLW